MIKGTITLIDNSLHNLNYHELKNAEGEALRLCPATDAIINEALTLTDQQERKDLYEELNEIALKTNIAAFYATTKLSWGLRKEVHGFVQENKAVMRVCGLEGSGINIWKEK